MRCKVRFVHVFLYRISVVVMVWLIAGCGLKSGKLPTFMRPELLYLKDRPYSRHYVEVDTVEGVEVPEQWVDVLKTFLETYCSKPDGIEIIQDPPVPLYGPDPSSGSQPAYFHVFFFDRNVGLKAEKGPPHVVSFCPCGILFDAGYFRASRGEAEEFSLKHELGHVCGLCKNPEHGDGAHCTNKGCLMNPSPSFLAGFGLLIGVPLKGQLCANCISDLQASKSEEIDPKLSFEGPFWFAGRTAIPLPLCPISMSLCRRLWIAHSFGRTYYLS